MKFFNKLFKLIKNIYIFIFSFLGLVLTALIGVFGYLLKDPNTVIKYLSNMNDGEPLPQEMIDKINTLSDYSNTIFIVAIVILSVFIGSLLIYWITLPFTKKKEKKEE